ncbi:hypothetical protein B0H10DRAFT_2222304 [Mycena sp. CBHHK59/15]|nr:hypothetical protein B0H10DRAFT_2222304 [Mycena sp. CBHHK59/15]
MENGRYLGIGTFKTAHPAYLTLIHLAAEGLGTTPNENVAIKLMYVRRAKPTESQPDGWIINRLMPADEYRKIIMEANVLLWAISIMTFTYSFIYHFIRTSAHPLILPPSRSPTFDLFTLLIDEEHDGFYKFINNGSAVPLLLPTADKSVAAVAEFLSFTQHVQFYKTKGMVYLSDLQARL